MDSAIKLNKQFDYTQVTWDEIHDAIDEINALGKAVNLSIYKTYSSLTVESGGKFHKTYAYAHSEFVTADITSKEATFNLIKNFFVNYYEKNLVAE